MDRYAACKSSKEVVEVQDHWLQECEEELQTRSSQGIHALGLFLSMPRVTLIDHIPIVGIQLKLACTVAGGFA